MKSSMTLGLSLLAGAALIETALIPGLVIGGVAVLAPNLLSKFMPKKRRRPRPSKAMALARVVPAVATTDLSVVEAPPSDAPKFAVKQAIFKTITFRMIATSVDFTANMLVIGDLATAAGLSAFGLLGAPLFYFGHELFWNRVAPDGTRVDLGTLVPHRRKLPAETEGESGLVVNRALAKTITYEVVVTTVDFTANFVATRDVVAAVVLTGFALVISPFLYFGHEKAWDYFGGRRRLDDAAPAPAHGKRSAQLLLAPA